MGRNPKKAGKKAKPKAGKAGGGGGEKMTSADDSDFELEDGVTVVTGETDDEMEEDGSERYAPRSPYEPRTDSRTPRRHPHRRRAMPREPIGRALMIP